MNTRFKIALAVVAGTALGAAAMQGLHAQAKPKAYQVTEFEVIDAAALKVFAPLVADAQKAGGGRNLRTGSGRIVATVGAAPKSIGITEWDSLEQAQAFVNSAAFSNLAPQRNKAEKYIRQYAVEATSN